MANLDREIKSFLADIESQVTAAAESRAPCAAPPEAFADRLTAIVDTLRDGLANIDEQEAAAILAKTTEAGTAFAAGNWLGGILATMAAMRMFRDAKRD